MINNLRKYWYFALVLAIAVLSVYWRLSSSQLQLSSKTRPEISEPPTHNQQPIRPLSVIAAVNAVRQQAQVPELKNDSRLFKSATAKANDMCDRGYFSHESPTGLNPWYWLQQSQFEFEAAGENLARHVTELPELITSWTESPTHFENMMDTRFTMTGVAVRTCLIENVETMVVVQHFASQTPAK